MKNSKKNINPENLSPRELKKLARQKVKRNRKIGYIMSLVQLFLTVLFCGLLVYLNIVPIKYLVPAIIALLILVGYVFLTQMGKKKSRAIGKIICVVMSIILALGSFYLVVTNNMLAAITGGNTKTDIVSVIVLKSDSAKDINDVKDYNFGISDIIDRNNTDKAIEKIDTLTESKIDTTAYDDYHELAKALLDGDTKVIIMNESYRSTINETYENFDDDTRVIKTFKFITKIDSPNDVEVTKDPFIIYLGGNDQYGDEVTATGRSDVNICAVVNPNTHQVLLVSTPRDYYIELVDANGNVPAGSLDKLTHAGNFGIDSSMKTLGKLYNTTIDYYVRVNFTGFTNIVDELDGITVDSEYDFTSIDGYHFNKGTNKLNGTYALHYARERKSFAAGDMQRNKHQTQVLQAIIDKITSTKILTNYTGIMSSVSTSFITNFDSKDISDLVKMQLNDGKSWEVLSYNVTGTGGKEYVYSIKSFPTSVVYQDSTQVDNAKSLIGKVMNGDTISQGQIDELNNSSNN